MATTYKPSKKQPVDLSIISDVIQNVMGAMKSVFGSSAHSASTIEQAIYEAYHISENAKKELIRKELNKSHKELHYY